MWARLSHILAPLTNIMSSKVNFKWTKIKQDAFKEMMWIVSHDIYKLIRILMKNLKFMPMIAISHK